MRTGDSLRLRKEHVRLYKLSLARKIENSKREPESYPKYPKQQGKIEQNQQVTYRFVCDWQQP